ncbi:MAG: peptidoglycan endopeptidase [Desulfuromonadaceae bacterium]|nr:peptidoglycan endopeptidase [Desulfuromonadaceae bacterium]MDD2854438.1 peptidoglycan endopeptidase [Desulfuromonadaceae bacterium]
MKSTVIIFIFLLHAAFVISVEASEYGVARIPTPVLNAPDFNFIFGGTDGRSLKTDASGQVRELEYIALPGTTFKIMKQIKSEGCCVYEVKTDEYTVDEKIRLYVDSRFIKVQKKTPPPRKHSLPDPEEIISLLKSAVGVPYVWGGNVLSGIPQLAELFYRNIDEKDKTRLTLAGLDCSGLLYYATAGCTPRNTSSLLMYGQAVPVEGMQSSAIVSILKPLDLIVWSGHLIIVLNSDTVIESRLEPHKKGRGGVITTPLQKRITEIMNLRKPVDRWSSKNSNSTFVIRRWYPEK